MTYLMCIKDRNALMSVEDAVLRSFDGEAPEGVILRTDNGPQYNSQQFRS